MSFTLVEPTDEEWIYCPTCKIDRQADSIDDEGTCPYCGESTIPPADETPQQEPTSTTFPQESVDKPSTQDEQEAFRAPYSAPLASIDPDIARELASRALCRRRLMPFIKKFRPKYTAGWVHEDICRRLEQFVKDVEAGLAPRLLLMMPPRAGKSEIGSRHFPPWALGLHPEWEIIAASHTSSLTMSFSRYVRDLVRDPAYTAIFPRTRLDPSSQSIENWNLASTGGGYLAAGVGTGITGRGAHILLLDDLVKDMEAADSQTIRDNTWEWYASTAYTRLAPGGGVIGIMCMTGDTPVLMADGSSRRLDALRPSDSIATYARGTLAQSRVAAVKLSGRDSIAKITMSSGRIVRANLRHPFLTVAPWGEVSWTRVKNLSTDHRIVVVKDSGVSGEALSALRTGAKSLPSVADFANITMPSRNGPTAIAPRQTTMSRGAVPDSSTATASQPQSTTLCTKLKAAVAQSARHLLKLAGLLPTGRASSQSITATTPVKSEDFCATVATPESDILVMSQWHLPPLATSDFTLDRVVSVEPDGEADVYDVQVDDTENFIANGLVSHNTWWHDDDWAGRIQQVMAAGDGDKFEIIKYPAINDRGDEYRLPDGTIHQFAPLEVDLIPEGSTLTRPHNTAIHPERYTTQMMLKIKANMYAAGQQRVWNSLYQQNPAPEDGLFFTKDMFRYYSSLPQRNRCRVYQAWDFAITEGTESDYTVGATIYQDEHDALYVVDMCRFKSGDSFLIVDQMLDYAAQWDVDMLGVEDGQIWKAMSALFDKRSQERRQYLSYEVLKPLTDKKVRASPLRGRMQQGKVYFNEKAPWFRELYMEMTRFPAGKHDDQIDALSWVTRLTLQQSAPQPRDRRDVLPSWRDKLRTDMSSGNGDSSHMAA